MSNNFEFKKTHSFEKRKLESERIRRKYPFRVPIIVEIAKGSNIPKLDKNKYLTPEDLTVGQFMYVIRKRIKLQPEQALFIFINNTIPPIAELMSNMYKEHKSSCGFLYCIVSGESTFGF